MSRIALAAAVVALLAPPGRAADPLAGVPAGATVVVVIDNPRELAERVRDHPTWKAAQTVAPVRDVLDSPAAKRFFDLVRYYEADMGKDWPAILDAVAGDGVTVAGVIGEDKGPAAFTVRGKDAAAGEQFVGLALKFIEAEAAKAADGGKPVKVRRAKHGDTETVHVGDEFHLARVGPVVTVGNREEALHKSLDAAAGRGRLSVPHGPTAAKKLLGGTPSAWAWVDLKAAKETPASKDFFAASKKEITQTLFAGSTIDAVERSDFLAVGLTADKSGGLAVKLVLPAGRPGLPPEFALHAPEAGVPGSLPLLNPPGTVYSQSFYLDLRTLWQERKKLFNEQALKDVEKFNKDVSKVLPGPKFGRLLEMTGAYHRVVFVAPPAEPLYKSTPSPALPGGAVVTSMRDPKFGRSAVAALRAGAAIAAVTTGLKMTEETVDGVEIVSYRFPEDKEVKDDPDGQRFHAVPSFAVVHGSLVVASRPDIIKALIPELAKQPAAAGDPAVWRARLSGAGLAAWARNHPDALVADEILNRGVTLEEAKKQVALVANILEKAGAATWAMDHRPDCYEWRLEWPAK